MINTNEYVLRNVNFCFFLSISEELVSSFENTLYSIKRALCSDHAMGLFRCKQNGSI